MTSLSSQVLSSHFELVGVVEALKEKKEKRVWSNVIHALVQKHTKHNLFMIFTRVKTSKCHIIWSEFDTKL